MDTNSVSTQPVARRGIHEVSWDLMQYLLDHHLNVFGVYKIAVLNKALWTTLQVYLYRRAAEHRKGRCRGGIRNIIKAAIRNDAEVKTLEMMIETCKPVWPWWLAGHDHWQVHPPLFVAAAKNRTDVIELLVAKGVDINTTYEYLDWRGYRYLEKFPGRPRGLDFGLRGFSDDCRGYEVDTVLDIAIRNRNWELLQHFLADPRIRLRTTSYRRALQAHWKAAIEAIPECDRWETDSHCCETQMQYILDEELLFSAEFDDPEWLEYLISLGANPIYPREDYDMGISADTPINRAIENRRWLNVFRLLRVVDFEWEYRVYTLLLCVESDDRLEVTKILLTQSCWEEGWAWMEAYAHGMYHHNASPGYNIKTMRYLLEYLEKLIESDSEIRMDGKLGDFLQPDDVKWYTGFDYLWGRTLFYHALLNTVDNADGYDWVRPLFHLHVDVTEQEWDSWSGTLYERYLTEFVPEREDRDELLSLYRRKKIDIDAVFDSTRNRNRGIFKLDIFEDEWERSPPEWAA
ncbi:hypothetical protein O1611_g8567 [Lasiodiplodia mahajangana]|uniref:Uncharacterized protein n=1 Tax=Lasiodiplodia mahajangana TaxID=1108764 RepID=A0ACC2JC36_9PEZI|nr:hypothetical protein O1611_g8567 [Lasiodiplodia mahajangana]